MKVRNRGAAPGARGEGTRPETAPVVDKVCDDHVDNLLGKPASRGVTCGGGMRRAPPKKYSLWEKCRRGKGVWVAAGMD